MSTESSPLKGPTMLAILRGAFDAIRASPVILGLFLASGILRFVLPPLIDSVAGAVLSSIITSTVRLLLISIGVLVAYRALGGRTRTDSPFLLRLFMAFLAMLASYLLLFVGILALFIPGAFRWIGFLVFVPLGVYVYVRLFLSTPAAMVDGYGPAEALSESWRLTNGSMLATTFALVLVFVFAFVVLFSVLWFVRSDLIRTIGGTLLLDTALAGMQAFLYLQLAKTS